MSFRMTITGLQETLNRMQAWQGSRRPMIQSALTKASLVFERELKFQITGPGTDETRLNRDTGTLIRSIGHTVTVGEPMSYAQVGFPEGRVTQIAATHEYGAIINARSAKMMRIKYPWRRALIRGGGRTARAMSGIPRRRSFFKDGYLFTTQVRIPKREFLQKSIDASSGRINDVFNSTVQDWIERHTTGATRP